MSGKVHEVVFYRGIDSDSYKIEWMVRQALTSISVEHGLRFDFTHIILPSLSEGEAALRIDDTVIPLTRAGSLDEIKNMILDALASPVFVAHSLLEMPLPPYLSGVPSDAVYA